MELPVVARPAVIAAQEELPAPSRLVSQRFDLTVQEKRLT
jgi:hypothetical protein